MAEPDTRDLTGPRWSTAVRCRRAAWYQLTGAEREPIRDDAEGYFKRGRWLADAWCAEQIAELASAGLTARAEEVVEWPRERPLGHGHADLYMVEQRRIIETYTSASSLPRAKALQAAGYALNHPDVTAAEVVIIDPSSLAERHYPLSVAGLTPAVEAIQDALTIAVALEVPPERACRHPGDAPGRYCSFQARCFAGWRRPPTHELIESPDLVAALYDADNAVKEARKAARELEAERDVLRERLTPILPPGEEVACAGFRLKATPVEGHATFDIRAALEAGHTLPDELVPYAGTSKGWTRVKVNAG